MFSMDKNKLFVLFVVFVMTVTLIIPTAFAAELSSNRVYTSTGSVVADTKTYEVYYNDKTPITYQFLLDNPNYAIRFNVADNSNTMIYFSINIPNEVLSIRSGSSLSASTIKYLCSVYPDLADKPIKFTGISSLSVVGEGQLEDRFAFILDSTGIATNSVLDSMGSLLDFILSSSVLTFIVGISLFFIIAILFRLYWSVR